MREIRLADCDIVVLSLEGETARRQAITALGGRLGLSFRIVDAIRCSPGPIGCGLSHLKALRAWDGARPLLVLEDDVEAGEDFQASFLAPDDADAIYLGVSRFGAVEAVDFVGFVDVLAAEPAASGLLRIHNMLGAHAILHLTTRWRDAAVEAMTAAMVDHGWDPDRGLARIQGHFNVYATERPAFYQTAALQPEGRGWLQEAATRALPPPPREGDRIALIIEGQPREVVLTRDGPRLLWLWAAP